VYLCVEAEGAVNVRLLLGRRQHLRERVDADARHRLPPPLRLHMPHAQEVEPVVKPERTCGLLTCNRPARQDVNRPLPHPKSTSTTSLLLLRLLVLSLPLP